MKTIEYKKDKKPYTKPVIVKISIDNQISLAMTSPSEPPADPFSSVDMKKMLELDKMENA